MLIDKSQGGTVIPIDAKGRYALLVDVPLSGAELARLQHLLRVWQRSDEQFLVVNALGVTLEKVGEF